MADKTKALFGVGPAEIKFSTSGTVVSNWTFGSFPSFVKGNVNVESFHFGTLLLRAQIQKLTP